MQVATTLSTTRARLVQSIERSRRVAMPLGHLFPHQFGRPAPRRTGASSVAVADLARPIRFPQRGRGSLVVDELPPVESRAFAAVVRSARAKRRVFLGPRLAPTTEVGRAVVALAASGAPLETSGPPSVWADAIGSDLAGQLAEPGTDEAHGRELRSVRLRRVALDLLRGDRSDPEVSVLLATRRPLDVPSALAQVAAQVGCRVQVLLGLHGDGWPGDDDQLFEQLPTGSCIARFDTTTKLGEILTALGDRADAELVSKWDDDDWYGPNHLADLVRAYDYSGADVVGKAAEFVHLEQPDLTIRRFAVGAESYTWTLAGGTLLTTRSWLDTIDGWPAVASGVDRAMLAATRRHGGVAYRTHGFEYVLRRSRPDARHTWTSVDSHFLAAATETRDGLDLAFADVIQP